MTDQEPRDRKTWEQLLFAEWRDERLAKVLAEWALEGLYDESDGCVHVPPIPTETLSLLATIRGTMGPNRTYPVPVRTLVSLLDELLEYRRRDATDH